MSHHPTHSNDPKVKAHMEKAAKHDHRSEYFFRRALHVIERIIAVITILALLGTSKIYERGKPLRLAGSRTSCPPKKSHAKFTKK